MIKIKIRDGKKRKLFRKVDKWKEIEVKNNFYDLTYRDIEHLKNDEIRKIYPDEFSSELMDQILSISHFMESDFDEFVNKVEPKDYIVFNGELFYLKSIQDLSFLSYINTAFWLEKGDELRAVLSIIITSKYPNTIDIDDKIDNSFNELKDHNFIDVRSFYLYIMDIFIKQRTIESQVMKFPKDDVRDTVNPETFFKKYGEWFSFHNYQKDTGLTIEQILLTKYSFIFLWKRIKCDEINYQHSYTEVANKMAEHKNKVNASRRKF